MTQKLEILKQAETLLIEFESSEDYSKKFDCFDEAMTILNQSLSDPGLSTDDINWIKQRKISITRVLLDQLPSIPPKQGINFFVLTRHVFDEVIEITSQDVSRKNNWNEFREHFRSDVIDMVEKILRKK